jgi:hypothetical protein
LHTEDDQQLRDAVAAIKRYGLLTAATKANGFYDDPTRRKPWERPFGRDDDAEAAIERAIPDIDELVCDQPSRGQADSEGVPEDVGAVRVCDHDGIDQDIGEDFAATVRVFQFTSNVSLRDRFRDYVQYDTFDGEETIERANCDRGWRGGIWTLGDRDIGRIACTKDADHRVTVWTDPTRKLIVTLELYPLDNPLPSDQQMFNWWSKLAGQLHRGAA